MPTSQVKEITPVLKWILDQLEGNQPIDDYALLQQILKTDPQLAQRVTAALQNVGVAKLTSQTYRQLDQQQFEVLLDVLLDTLELTLEAAYELFCVKLKWCKRRDGWRSLWRHARAKVWERVPAQLRNRAHKLGPLAAHIWDLVMVYLKVSERVELTTASARIVAFLAIKGLDELCRCNG